MPGQQIAAVSIFTSTCRMQAWLSLASGRDLGKTHRLKFAESSDRRYICAANLSISRPVLHF